MKKPYRLTLLAAAGMLLLAGCGSYDADENTLFIKRNGEIYETNVQTYEGDQYSADELQAFIDEEIGAYDGEGSVKVEKFEMEGPTATLTTKYSDGKTYADFNKRAFFNGKVVLAQADGFNFNAPFFERNEKASGDTEAGGTAVPRDQVIDNPNLSVVILSENTIVSVPGKILYYSEHVTPQDKHTAKVEGYGADGVAAGPAYIIYQ
ncbi:MAG: hypothetical protein IJJ13_02910 [Lachnospiraceae bacterium]|nr:hypothetical protein [Lachnospiraceae bacterium]